jgi:hypothetical protein
MKKLQLQVIILASTLGLNAQTKSDSLKNFRLSGISLETQFTGKQVLASNAKQEDFQKFVKNDELLDKSLIGYDSKYGYGHVYDVNGFFSLRAFFELGQGKRYRREGFIGIRAGSNEISKAAYNKTTYDTTGVYINAANNDKLYSVDQYNNTYIYQISSRQIFVPIGVNFTTNKNKRFWFGLGAELSPGISYANTFSAFNNLNKTELLLNASSSYDNYSSYSTGSYKNLEMKQSSVKVQGVGFVGYAAIPFTMNLRMSKSINSRKHLSASASIAPGFYYSNNKFVGSQSSIGLNASLGLRYNW